MYSSIKKKKCKCSEHCVYYPSTGYAGYYSTHAPEKIKATQDAKTKKRRSDANKKKQATIKRRLYKAQEEGVESDAWKSKLWFAARRFEMTGRCVICGGKTCKDADNFKNSIAHLFGKRDAAFPSIKWHPENWIELCFWGNSHHTNFDNCIFTFEDLKQTKAWDEVVRKTKILYPLMTIREQGRVPDILLETIKDLVGEHELSGLDTDIKKAEESWEGDATVYRFVLDGKTYKAIEDPGDGYRSNLAELEVTDEKVDYTFPPQKVIGKMRADEDYSVNDVIDFSDAITGKIVLSIGTENTDDYYPSCIMNWHQKT